MIKGDCSVVGEPSRSYRRYKKLKIFSILNEGILARLENLDGTPDTFRLVGRLGVAVWFFPILCLLMGVLGGLLV